MKKRRSSGEIFGLAFLDVIACGFGAIVLLLLISRPAPLVGGGEAPPPVDAAEFEDASDLVSQLRARWDALQAVLANEPERPVAANAARVRRSKRRSGLRGNGCGSCSATTGGSNGRRNRSTVPP